MNGYFDVLICLFQFQFNMKCVVVLFSNNETRA